MWTLLLYSSFGEQEKGSGLDVLELVLLIQAKSERGPWPSVGRLIPKEEGERQGSV